LPVFNGKKIVLDLDYVLHRLRISEEQQSRNVRFIEALRDGIGVVRQNAFSSVFYRVYAYNRSVEGRVDLDGFALNVGEVVSGKLIDAQSVLIGIATIGSGVEDMAREAKSVHGLTHSFALEALGAIALDMGMEEYFTCYDEKLALTGLYTGVPLSPGETEGWILEDQLTIYNALQGELVDVSISEALMLIPKNSVSFLVGIYDHPVKGEHEFPCDYCSMRDNCLYRRVE
jgi:hypothetical protein